MPGKFKIYQDRVGWFRWRLLASNGMEVAHGDAYRTKAAAKKACISVQRAADGAEIVEVES